MKTSKYQGVMRREDFPALEPEDLVSRAAMRVMVYGHTIEAAANVIGVNRHAVGVKCHRIAQRHKRARIGVHAAALYGLCQRAAEGDNSTGWHEAWGKIINEVEGES